MRPFPGSSSEIFAAPVLLLGTLLLPGCQTTAHHPEDASTGQRMEDGSAGDASAGQSSRDSSAGDAGAGTAGRDGNGECEHGETPKSAPRDCESAGDGLCTGHESIWDTPEECRVQRISVSADGAELEQGAETYGTPSLSADGSRVAFTTKAALVEADQNDVADVYVYDFQASRFLLATPRLGVIGNDPQTGAPVDLTDGKVAYLVDLGDDGRRVAFSSASADYVGKFVTVTSEDGSVTYDVVGYDSNGKADIYVTDLKLQTIERASMGLDGRQFTSDCWSAGFTRDGKYVHFAKNGDMAGSLYDLASGDRKERAGALVGKSSDALGGHEVRPCGKQLCYYDAAGTNLEQVTALASGEPANGSSLYPSLSLDGRFVAFMSAARNLAFDANGHTDAFVHDRVSGRNLRVSVPQDGREKDVQLDTTIDGADVVVTFASMSGDGRFVAFTSYQDNLVPGDNNGKPDAFVAYIGDWLKGLPSK